VAASHFGPRSRLHEKRPCRGITPLRPSYAEYSHRAALKRKWARNNRAKGRKDEQGFQQNVTESTTDAEKKGFDNRAKKRAEREAKQVLRLYAEHTPEIHALAPSNSYVGNRKVVEQKMDTEIRQQIQRGSDSGSLGRRVEARPDYAFTPHIRRAFSEPSHLIVMSGRKTKRVLPKQKR